MFELFTHDARRVVVLAQEDAREYGADRIRSEHLLVSVFRVGSRGAAVLAAHGVMLDDITAELRSGRPAGPDRDALASVGIDLDEVRERVEEAFGPGALENTRAAGMRRPRSWGHIPFDRDAKKVLELALREAVRRAPTRAHTLRAVRDAIRRGDRSIGSEHIVLGLLHPDTGRAGHLLAARGLTLDGVRATVDDAGPEAASG